MNAGALRHRVQVQTPTQTKDDTGGYTEAWATIADGDCWADVRPASGGFIDRIFGARVAGVTTQMVTIRYIPSVTTACRVVLGSRYLNVRGVADVDERGRWLLLACEESGT